MKRLVVVNLVLPYAVVELNSNQNAGVVDSLFASISDAQGHACAWSRRTGKPFVVVGRFGVLVLFCDGVSETFDKERFGGLFEIHWMFS